MSEPRTDPAGRPGPPEPDLPGPFPAGRYAARLRDKLRSFSRVRLIGEVAGLRVRRAGMTFFELRDAEGAIPCKAWGDVIERMGLPDGALRDGAEVVVSGGLDYYPGSQTASPSLSFQVTHLRLAGEGDLLARLEELRRLFRAEGLTERQKVLPLAGLPRTIGVVTSESGAARRDLLAALDRRGWRGAIVWAFAPVQDRHAAPAIARALSDLSALPEVETIVVCRGGGSLSDLWAFCDETLCRTVALLGTPVISAVGHETDRTLLDDVAAISCSTPTHAAEAAVRVDCDAGRRGIADRGARLDAAARRSARHGEEVAHAAGLRLRRASTHALSARGRRLVELARVPAVWVSGERRRLHQELREIRAAAARGLGGRTADGRRVATVLGRKADAAALAGDRSRAAVGVVSGRVESAAAAALDRRRDELGRLSVALRAHDPERTLERGYAIVEDSAGEPLTSIAAAAPGDTVGVRMKDGRLRARIEEREEST